MTEEASPPPPAHGDGVDQGHVADTPAAWEYASLSMDELLVRATMQGVPRRWDMSRRELILTLAGDPGAYDDLTVEQLRHLAEKRDISGRSKMTKAQLISALVDPGDS